MHDAIRIFDLFLACGFLWGAGVNHSNGEPVGFAAVLAVWFLILAVVI